MNGAGSPDGKDAMAPDREKGLSTAGPRTGLIATIPKSGTWYCHYFFHFYRHLLQGRQDVGIEVNTRPHKAAEIGLDVLLIAHTICPGFDEYQGEFRQAWDRIGFYHPGYNWALGFIRDRPHWYDPARNHNARIICLFRNPLDQAVSYYRYTLKNRQADTRYRTNERGIRVRIKDVRDFLLNAGLESYLKQFLTFKVMADRYPDRIMPLTYEKLVGEPRASFRTILRHFGHDPEIPAHRPAFETALKASHMDSLKGIENALGRSLADDQTDPAERHIRDGATGKWKRHFTPEDIESVESRLNEFGLSLRDFEIK